MFEKVLKDFTMVDLWGILTPGAIFTLLTDEIMHYGDLCSLFLQRDIEDVSELVLIVYLIIVSYIVGSILHEVADWCELLLSVFSKFIVQHISVFQKNRYLCIYLRLKAFLFLSSDCKKEFLENSPGKLLTEVCSKERLNDMQISLEGTLGASKRQMFDSFRIMSRNSCLTMILLLLFYNIQNTSGTSSSIFQQHKLIIVIISILFAVRAMHYTFLKHKYTMESYIYLNQSEKVEKL